MPLFGDNRYFNAKTLLTTLFATIITVGAGIYVTRIVGPVPLSIQQTITEKQTTFDVIGETEISAVPDQAEISLGVEITRSTVVEAQEAVNEVTNNITESLKQLGIDKSDIRTRTYTVNPQYDFATEQRRITGYLVTSQLVVTTTDFNNLNQVIDTATGLGANQIGGISFSFSKELEDKLTKQAREEAITDAKEDAKELSRLSGITLGKVVNISESRQNGEVPQPFIAQEMRAVDAEGPQEPTQVEPGTTSFRYQVKLSYETR